MGTDKFGWHSLQKGISSSVKRNLNKLVGYSIEADGSINFQNRRLCNITFPKQETDSVNLQCLKFSINQSTQDILTLMQQKINEGYNKIEKVTIKVENDNLNFINEYNKTISHLNQRIDAFENYIFDYLINKKTINAKPSQL